MNPTKYVVDDVVVECCAPRLIAKIKSGGIATNLLLLRKVTGMTIVEIILQVRLIMPIKKSKINYSVFCDGHLFVDKSVGVPKANEFK